MSGPDLDRKASARLWVFAAVAAVALHLGGAALAFAHLRNNGSDEGLGAAGAEFAVELASPKEHDEEQPPGPLSGYSQPQEEIKEQKAEVNDTQLPKDRPMEAEDPDRIVTASDTKKPKDEEAKVATVETQAQDYSPAQEAKSPTKLDQAARESETAKASNPGLGKDNHALAAKWEKQIGAYFQQHLRYPEVKQTKALMAKLRIVLNRLGRVVSLEVVESSGDPRFDEAALSMVHSSDPVPPPPAALTADTFGFTLPVKFTKPK